MTKSEITENKVEYLSFNLGAEEYGIEIKSVQEIKGYDNVTPLPGVADFIKGIVNLRGAIVPIIDLRVRLSVGAPTYISSTAVIIVDINNKFYGIIVDRVSDVVSLSPEHLRPTPHTNELNTDFIIGLASLEDRLIILLDIKALLTDTSGQLIT